MVVEKRFFQRSHRMKKKLSEQVVPITYTQEESFFAAATFVVLGCFFSDRLRKFVAYVGLYESSLHFYQRNTFMRSKLTSTVSTVTQNIGIK